MKKRLKLDPRPDQTIQFPSLARKLDENIPERLLSAARRLQDALDRERTLAGGDEDGGHEE